MALGTFSDLKAAVTRWLARSDLAGDAEDFITLGEAGLNRELPAVETDTPLVGTVGERVISISSIALVEPRGLFLIDPDTGDEDELTPLTDGTFPYFSTNSRPQSWSIDGTNIKFDYPLDRAYSFRFEYHQRFALSDSAPTNWLLTNHPDVYLAAVLLWGGVFTRNSAQGQAYAAILSQALPSVRNIIAQKKRALLRVDNALRAISRRWHYTDGTEL